MATQKKPLSTVPLFLIGALLFALTGLFNVGIIAMDDYSDMMAWIIPAQSKTFTLVSQMSSLRSLLGPFTLLILTKMALALGIVNPIWQLKFALCLYGLFSFTVCYWVGTQIFDDLFQRKLWTLAFPFYCLMPLFLTRPLIESLCVPTLMLSLFFADRYWKTSSIKALIWAAVLLAIASFYRYQCLCLYAALLILISTKPQRVKTAIPLILCALFSVGLLGLVDFFARGKFLSSLLEYIKYNLASSSSYGTSPFYTYLALFIALSIPPTFFAKLNEIPWRSHYHKLLPAITYFTIFVGVHSLIPHKEERFILPVLPIFLMLLIPTLCGFYLNSKTRWRTNYFLMVNVLLVPWVSFSVPQNNLVGLCEYLNHHPDIHTLAPMKNSLLLFPDAFLINPVEVKEEVKVFSCQTPLLTRDDLEVEPSLTEGLIKVASFSPAALEKLVIKLNPKQNRRRSALHLWIPKNCL